MQLDRTEARVLGALVEKRWTTPDQYPLSLNALVLACNQKSNRDPVLALEEFEVTGCLLGLRQRSLVMVHEQYGGRVPRYGEKLMEELRLSRQAMAILAELLLRGPQTAGELYRRCPRMADFANQGEVDAHLRDLAGSHYVTLLARETGQRHARWKQLLCRDRTGAGEGAEDGSPAGDACDDEHDVAGPGRIAPPAAGPVAHAPVAHAPVPRPGPAPDVHAELAALRAEVTELRRRVGALEDAATGAH